MTVRKKWVDTRTDAEKRSDERVARLAEKGLLVDPRVRAAAIARVRARHAARKRLRQIGEIQLHVLISRDGADYVAYAPLLPSVSAMGRTRSAVRARLRTALDFMIEKDPERVLETVEGKNRIEETLRVRVRPRG